MSNLDYAALAAAERIMRKTERPLLSESQVSIGNGDNCRAQVRVYIGQRKPGGTWHQCGKKKRAGKKTCRWHAHLEDESEGN